MGKSKNKQRNKNEIANIELDLTDLVSQGVGECMHDWTDGKNPQAVKTAQTGVRAGDFDAVGVIHRDPKTGKVKAKAIFDVGSVVPNTKVNVVDRPQQSAVAALSRKLEAAVAAHGRTARREGWTSEPFYCPAKGRNAAEIDKKHKLVARTPDPEEAKLTTYAEIKPGRHKSSSLKLQRIRD